MWTRFQDSDTLKDMKEALSRETERVADLPLLQAQRQHTKPAELLDKHVPTNGKQEELSQGEGSMIWLTHMLSQADHRINCAPEWARRWMQTLQRCGKSSLSLYDLTDDRLADVRRDLCHDTHWQAYEQELVEQLVRASDFSAQRMH